MPGPTLSATLEARLDGLRQNFADAGNMAASAVSDIEKQFADANPQLGGLSSVLGGIAGGAAFGALLKQVTDLNKAMADLEDNAKAVGLTVEQFQSLQFAAGQGGLSNSDFVKGITEMATRLNDASRSENDLTKILDANGQKYKDQNGTLISIDQLLTIAANLIQNAGTELDKVKIADMLGLTKEWVPALEQGGAAFNQIANGAQAAGVIIDAQTVQKAAQFSREWDAASAQWKAQMQAALAGFLPMIDELIAKVQQFASTSGIADAFKSSFGTLATQNSQIQSEIDPIIAAFKNLATGVGDNQQVFDAFKNLLSQELHFTWGDTVDTQTTKIETSAQRISDAFKAFATAQASTSSLGRAASPADPTKIPGGDTDSTAALDRAEDQIKKRTAEHLAEAQAVGLDSGAKAQLKAQADLNAAADKDGITLTDEQKQEITQLAAAYGQAAQAAANAKQQFQANNQALQFGGDQVISALDGIRTGSLTAAQALNQLVNALITAIEKALLLGQGPLAGLFGTQAAAGSGGTGGLLGSIFGLSGAGAAASSSSGILVGPAALGLQTFASGTDSAPGGLAIVGENGPELVNLPGGSQVIPNGALNSISSGGASMDVKISIDLSGANGDETIKMIAQQAAAAGVQQAVSIANQAAPSRQLRFEQLGT